MLRSITCWLFVCLLAADHPLYVQSWAPFYGTKYSISKPFAWTTDSTTTIPLYASDKTVTPDFESLSKMAERNTDIYGMTDFCLSSADSPLSGKLSSFDSVLTSQTLKCYPSLRLNRTITFQDFE